MDSAQPLRSGEPLPVFSIELNVFSSTSKPKLLRRSQEKKGKRKMGRGRCKCNSSLFHSTPPPPSTSPSLSWVFLIWNHFDLKTYKSSTKIYFPPRHFGASGWHDIWSPWVLYCILPTNEDILLRNNNTMIICRKLTLRCLILKPCWNFTSCFSIAKRSSIESRVVPRFYVSLVSLACLRLPQY